MTATSQTSGIRSTTPQSPHFITVGRRRPQTEAKRQRRLSNRRKNVRSSPTFNGWWDTRTRRRYSRTCIFSLSDYNRLGPASHSSRYPIVLWSVSGSGNESTPQPCELMTIHRDSCSTYTTTDASTTNHNTAPAECPACDCPEITIENDLWRCTLCNASGLLGGERA
jgi:hypothetical protein